MKNLTENQRELIELISNEFVTINEKKSAKIDDIFAHIDSEVNKKKIAIEEAINRNKLYNGVVLEKIYAIHERISNIANRYVFYSVLRPIYQTKHNFISSACIEIQDHVGRVIQEICIFPNTNPYEYIETYKDGSVNMYTSYSKILEIEESNLDKFVANEIIKVLKSRID